MSFGSKPDNQQLYADANEIAKDLSGDPGRFGDYDRPADLQRLATAGGTIAGATSGGNGGIDIAAKNSSAHSEWVRRQAEMLKIPPDQPVQTHSRTVTFEEQWHRWRIEQGGKLASQRAALLTYLQSKLEADDMHAVQDAASDIREIDAKLSVLKG